MEENGSETELKTLDDEAIADRLDAGLVEPVMIVGEDVAEPEIEVGTNVTVTLGRVVGFCGALAHWSMNAGERCLYQPGRSSKERTGSPSKRA